MEDSIDFVFVIGFSQIHDCLHNHVEHNDNLSLLEAMLSSVYIFVSTGCPVLKHVLVQ
jgi:hypothetical protein